MEKQKKSNEKMNDTIYGTLSSFDMIKLLIEEEHNLGYDTVEVGNEGKIKYNEVLLPKSNLISYHLYRITDTRVSTVLERLNEPTNAEESDIAADSIDKFMKRASLYIHHLLKDKPVDIITFPQDSSDFNKNMVDSLMERFDKKNDIRCIPDLFVKDIKSAYVNTDVAKRLGLPNYEIHLLMEDVERWKEDAEIYGLQVRIDELNDSIAYVSGKGGRPTREVSTKKELVENLKKQITLLKTIREGGANTKGSKGRTTCFDIDSIDERRRRSIEGLYNINLNLKEMRHLLRGKHIVVFDSHISYGTTLDDICRELQRYNVASIIPITLAVLPKVPMPR